MRLRSRSPIIKAEGVELVMKTRSLGRSYDEYLKSLFDAGGPGSVGILGGGRGRRTGATRKIVVTEPDVSRNVLRLRLLIAWRGRELTWHSTGTLVRWLTFDAIQGREVRA